MNPPARIYDTDSIEEIASKIYNQFEVGQSCAIKGTIIRGDDILTKGELVLNHMQKLYSEEFMKPDGKTRKMKLMEHSIGGFLAHKIWKWTKKDLHKYTIWRIQ